MISRYNVLSIALCCFNTHAAEPLITRAVNTTVFNNMLAQGSLVIQGNLTVDGTISGTLESFTAVPLTSTSPTTPNAIVMFADTMGSLITDAGVILDDANNMSGTLATGANTLSITHTCICVSTLSTYGITCNQSIEITPDITSSTTPFTFNVASTSSMLILRHDSEPIPGGILTINFPENPINGQLFTITNGESTDIIFALTAPGGATIINEVTTLTAATSQASTYQYYETDTAWYLSHQ